MKKTMAGAVIVACVLVSIVKSAEPADKPDADAVNRTRAHRVDAGRCL